MDALCIINNHSEILFSTCFDPNVDKNIFDGFISYLASEPNPKPYTILQEIEFVYILRDELYWCCCYKKGSLISRCGPLAVVDNLRSLHQICLSFLGIITQHAILANIVVLQEIILEAMGGGYLQIQDPDKLQSHICSKIVGPRESSVINISSGLFGIEKSAPTTASRKSLLAVDSGKKEVFVDVVERISATVGAEGILLRSEVSGSVVCHSFLSQTPCQTVSLTLNSFLSSEPSEGFTSSIQFSSVEFEKNVDTSKLSSKRELWISNKRGELPVLTYSLPSSEPHVLPFELTASHQQLTESDVEIKLKLTSKTGMGTVAPNVVVIMIAPTSTSAVMSHTNGPRKQSVSFDSAGKTVTWALLDFPGGSYAQASFRLVDAGDGSKIQSANLEFEVSKWVSSGLKVEHITFLPPVNDAQKWVRYLAVSDTVIFRFS